MWQHYTDKEAETQISDTLIHRLSGPKPKHGVHTSWYINLIFTFVLFLSVHS